MFKPTPEALLQWAKKYNQAGFAVQLLKNGTKGPFLSDWQRKKLSLDELEHYITNRADITGLGAVTGILSGNKAVIDFDEQWEPTYEHFMTCWSELTTAPIVKTAHDRRHLWLVIPDMPPAFTKAIFWRGDSKIELRGNRHFTALPPSYHSCRECPHKWCKFDTAYEWLTTSSDWIEVSFDELYSWLVEWSDRCDEGWKNPKPVQSKLDDYSPTMLDTLISGQDAPKAMETARKIIQDSQDGEKHTKLLNASILLGGYVATHALDENKARDLLQSEIGKKSNVASLKDAHKTIEKGLAYGAGRPFTAERVLADKVEFAQQQEQVVIPTASDNGTEPAEKPRITFKPWVWPEFLSRPPKQWFYQNFIGPGDIVVIAGDSGCGKTAIALDFAMCGLMGKQFANQFDAARPLKIAFCTAEGIGNLPARIKAAQEQHDVPLDVLERQFFGYDGPIVPQFFLSPDSEYSIEQFERDLQALYIEPDILIVDTIALAASGGNLEDNGDVTFIMHRARQFTNRTNIAVKFSHHNNREGAFRGAASLRDNSDGLFVARFDKDKDERKLMCKGEKWAKLKDGEEWTGRLYELESHSIHPAPIVNWLGEYIPKSGDGLIFKDELKNVMPFGEKWTVQEIKGALGDFFAPSTITNNVNKLYKAGELNREVDNPAEKPSKKNPYRYWWTAKALL